MKKNERIKLEVELKRDFLVFSLKRGDVVIGETKTDNDKTLSEKMLPLLDIFLKKNKVEIQEIQKTDFKSDIQDYFTSYRIVKVILDVLKWDAKFR